MKFDIFYQLPAADTQNVQTRYRELIDESIEADRLGFDTVWLAEVHFAPRFSTMPTPLLLLAAIAERTTKLRLGTAVNLMPLHQPLRLAEEIATLDVISGGRVEFGGGPRRVPAQLSRLRRRYDREPPAVCGEPGIRQARMDRGAPDFSRRAFQRREYRGRTEAATEAASADSPRRQQRRYFHLRGRAWLSDFRRRPGQSDSGAGRATGHLQRRARRRPARRLPTIGSRPR